MNTLPDRVTMRLFQESLESCRLPMVVAGPAASLPQIPDRSQVSSPWRTGSVSHVKGESMSSHLGIKARQTMLCAVLIALLAFAPLAFSQSSVSAGSISGTVTDQSGATVPNAPV